jgi:ABC-2 type transport system permease protein
MTAAVRIAAKDLRQRLRDRSALLLAVVLPLVLAVIFNAIFGGSATPSPFRYAVVDLDGGLYSQVFISDVLGALEQEDIAELREVADPAEARRLAEEGDVHAAFVLPAGFSAAVQAQQAARIEVIESVDAGTGSQVARSLAESFVLDLNTIRVALLAALGTDHEALPPEQVEAIAQRAVATTEAVVLDDVSAAEKILSPKTQFAAGMAVFFLMFTVQFGVASILDERNEGTLSRLLAAPIRRSAVLLGKLLSSVVLGVLSMAVLAIATSLFVGADWGNPVGVAALIVAGVLAATGIVAIVASLARTPDQVGSWTAIIAVTLGLLGGAFFPISSLGGFVAWFSLLTPHAWFLRGLSELAGGGGLASVLPAVAALLAFATVACAVALLRLNRTVQP